MLASELNSSRVEHKEHKDFWGWGIFTTEYTEAVEPILKITEKISVISVGERSDLSVCSVVKIAAGGGDWPCRA